MTTSVIASLAMVPVVAFAMPMMHGHENGDLHVRTKASVETSSRPAKDHSCRDLRLAFNAEYRAALKAWRTDHQIRSFADAKAYIKVHKEWNMRRRDLLKQIRTGECAASSASSTSSSMSSTSSSTMTSSSVSSSTSSEATSSSMMSSSSSSENASASGSSVEANASMNSFFSLFLGQ